MIIVEVSVLQYLLKKVRVSNVINVTLSQFRCSRRYFGYKITDGHHSIMIRNRMMSCRSYTSHSIQILFAHLYCWASIANHNLNLTLSFRFTSDHHDCTYTHVTHADSLVTLYAQYQSMQIILLQHLQSSVKMAAQHKPCHRHSKLVTTFDILSYYSLTTDTWPCIVSCNWKSVYMSSKGV